MQKSNNTRSQKKFDINSIKEVLLELKKEIKGIYDRRFKKLILYGSYARAEAWEGSDIDVVIILAGKVYPGKEIDRMLDILTDINLKHNVLISVYPVSEKSLKTIKSPLLLNIQREGITI